MTNMYTIVTEACMGTWNRRQQWNERNLGRRRAMNWPEQQGHYVTCKTNCDEPLELINIVDADPEYECAHGHVNHQCNCANIAANFYAAAAEVLDRGDASTAFGLCEVAVRPG